MQIFGLDVGDKTVGVAKSDPLGYTAQPVTTLRYEQSLEVFKKLALLVREEKIEKIVVGFPLNMNGTEGPRVEKVKIFVEGLRVALERLSQNPEIIFWDERMSTQAAERSLLEADLSRAKRKKVIDKMAAVFILQGYLDSLAPG